VCGAARANGTVELPRMRWEEDGGGEESAMMGFCDASCFQKLLHFLEDFFVGVLAFAYHRLTSLIQRFSSNHLFKQR
jgi:hypothetical protein